MVEKNKFQMNSKNTKKKTSKLTQYYKKNDNVIWQITLKVKDTENIFFSQFTNIREFKRIAWVCLNKLM